MDVTIIRDKLVGSENERAVSPVIGVILMVAITVILAAVIAAFVMDLGDMSESANAGIDFNEDGDFVTPQVIDEGNTDSIYVELEDGSDNTDYLTTSYDLENDEDAWTVGDSVEINTDGIGTDSDDIDDNSGDFDGDISNDNDISAITVYGEVGGDRQVIATWQE